MMLGRLSLLFCDFLPDSWKVFVPWAIWKSGSGRDEQSEATTDIRVNSAEWTIVTVTVYRRPLCDLPAKNRKNPLAIPAFFEVVFLPVQQVKVHP
jgi:hypothetical protein